MAREHSNKRYAQALFGLGQEQERVEAWLDQLRQAQLALSDSVISAYVRSPRVRLEQKMELVQQLLSGLDKLVVNAIGLLISRRALAILPAIVREYSALLDDQQGRLQATATSAVALSDEQRTRLGTLLHQVLDKEVVLEVREDPELIGGIVVKVGDQVIDGSVRTRLQQLRRQLVEQPTG